MNLQEERRLPSKEKIVFSSMIGLKTKCNTRAAIDPLLLYGKLDDFTLALIDELRMPGFNSGRYTLQSKQLNIPERNEGKLISLLKKLPGFAQFLKFNSVDDNLLKISAKFFVFEFCPKGQYLFREGDRTTKFYGIIKGRISLRVKKKTVIEKEKEPTSVTRSENYNNTTKMRFYHNNNESNLTLKRTKSLKGGKKWSGINIFGLEKLKHMPSLKIDGESPERTRDDEIERLQLSEGMCFGEWAILYGTPRSTSAYCLEDCLLFYMDKEKFEHTLGKALTKAETERRAFLCKTIPLFQKLPKHRFEEYYRKCIFMKHYKRNDVVFRENEPTGSLYLIYLGSCAVKMDLTQPYKVVLLNPQEPTERIANRNNIDYEQIFQEYLIKNSIDIQNCDNVECFKNTNNLETIMHLQKGDLSGLEICAGLTKLNQTLVASADFTVILKLDLRLFEEYRSQICEELLPLFTEKEKIMEKLFNDKKEERKKKKLNYRTLLKSANHFRIESFPEGKNRSEKVETNEGGFIKQTELNKSLIKEDDLIMSRLDNERRIHMRVKSLLSSILTQKINTSNLVKLSNVSLNNEHVLVESFRHKNQKETPKRRMRKIDVLKSEKESLNAASLRSASEKHSLSVQEETLGTNRASSLSNGGKNVKKFYITQSESTILKEEKEKKKECTISDKVSYSKYMSMTRDNSASKTIMSKPLSIGSVEGVKSLKKNNHQTMSARQIAMPYNRDDMTLIPPQIPPKFAFLERKNRRDNSVFYFNSGGYNLPLVSMNTDYRLI